MRKTRYKVWIEIEPHTVITDEEGKPQDEEYGLAIRVPSTWSGAFETEEGAASFVTRLDEHAAELIDARRSFPGAKDPGVRSGDEGGPE